MHTQGKSISVKCLQWKLNSSTRQNITQLIIDQKIKLSHKNYNNNNNNNNNNNDNNNNNNKYS